MKVLITGATGYLGRHLLKELTKQNYELYALVRKTSNTEELIKSGVTCIKVDIADKECFSQLADNFDVIIHLAFSLFPASDSRINENGFDNIINHFKNKPVKRFIYVSSALVYGCTAREDEISESHPCNPTMYFAKQQLRAENKLTDLYYSCRFPCVILRPSEIYGGEGGFFKTSQLDGYINGKTPIIGNGENAVSFTFIGDLVQTILSSMEKPGIEGEIFNINTPGVLTINELIQLIKSKIGTKHIYRIPAFMGWIVAGYTQLIAKLNNKVPSINFDIIRVATMKSGARSILKAEKMLGFIPKYKNISLGLSDCYFND